MNWKESENPIFMAEKSGIRVKINTVLQKGVNDEEWKVWQSWRKRTSWMSVLLN